MPQGGVDQGETYLDAMKRELSEETSIKNIEILKEVNGWTEYELPDYLLGKIWKGKYRGQKQKWFVVRFLGDDDEINLNIGCPSPKVQSGNFGACLMKQPDLVARCIDAMKKKTKMLLTVS